MYIPRRTEKFLGDWKGRPHRKPLIMRGARQTGKSRLVKEFGKKHYNNVVVLDLENEPDLRPLFERPNVRDILRELEVLKDAPIEAGKTLLFIDEIQACPPAIMKLRYFYEDAPEYHVIAAGSLLEFVLESEELSFPVGRVEFHYLFPLTFEEFLAGCGKERLSAVLKTTGTKDGISPQVHEEFRKMLESYFLIGGMPEAAANFIETGQYREAELVKESIIETYRDDFRKYSKRVNIENVDHFFREAPWLIGKRLNLSKAGAGEITPREAGTALGLLQKAMILYRVDRAQGVSFPLLPYKKAQPKLVFLDLGLAQHMNHISKEIIQSENYHSIYKGGFVEQLVGQEFLSYSGEHRRPELFYWQRDVKGATAKVDYIFPFKSQLLPVEVKAGRGTTLFSLHRFMAEYRPPLAIRIYDGPLQSEELNISHLGIRYRLLSIPLYMISELPRLLEAEMA